MKVALVICSQSGGGLEKHVVELSNELSMQGLEVAVIAHSSFASSLNSRVQFLPVDLTKGRRNIFSLLYLWRAIKKAQPDIIHAHARKAMSMVGLLLLFLRIPAIATTHNIKKSLPYAERFAKLIAVSGVAAKNLSHPNVSVVHNGVRPPHRLASEEQRELRRKLCLGNKPVFISIGRLVKVKGFDLLLEAWDQIMPDAILLIVGDGVERPILENKMSKMRSSSSVRFLGVREDIASLLSISNCMIISSRHEGGPYTLAEALLIQCPVISTRVGMTADYLPEEYLCEPDSVDALARLLTSALSSLSDLQLKQYCIFSKALDSLSLQSMASKTIDIYREV